MANAISVIIFNRHVTIKAGESVSIFPPQVCAYANSPFLVLPQMLLVSGKLTWSQGIYCRQGRPFPIPHFPGLLTSPLVSTAWEVTC